MCKISIITVCFNAEHEIEQTLTSVLNQTYDDFEYIIIDGKSLDGTTDIIKRYQSTFSKKGISVFFISEKDNGIYNAMNKGISKTNGEWFLFLNSGDYLCDNNVLEKISNVLNNADYDIVYGDAILKSNSMYKYDKSKPLYEIKEHMVFSHQSTFIHNLVMKKFMYDEQYRIAADYNFFIKLYLADYRFHSVDFPIAVFSLGGVSTNLSYNKKREMEDIEIYYRNGLIDENECKQRLKKINKNAFLRSIKNKIKLITPKAVLIKRVERYYKIDGWSERFPLY